MPEGIELMDDDELPALVTTRPGERRILKKERGRKRCCGLVGYR